MYIPTMKCIERQQFKLNTLLQLPVNTQHSCTFDSDTIHHRVVCRTTGPHPLPKGVLVLPLFSFQFPLVSLRSSSSCLPLLPRILVLSSLPHIFPLMTCFRRQFIHKMKPRGLQPLPAQGPHFNGRKIRGPHSRFTK
jgi:hypothetical protein